MEEIERGQADPDYRLQMQKEPDQVGRTKGPRYTPVSKRQDKPDGIAWLIRNHPELSDGQIGKLIGTTRTTIQAIRERSHWNIANIQPKDPVTLGLTSQRELDAVGRQGGQGGRHRAAPTDTALDGDREALIEELRAEREAAAREAEAAQAAEPPSRRAGARRASPKRALSTPSRADAPAGSPRRRRSTDAGRGLHPQGLTYPLGRSGPRHGELIALADGIGWTRLPVPGSLNHINIWLLEMASGVAIVDTGLDIPPCREAWEALFAGPLAGRDRDAGHLTHFHPDHLGLAGWLGERFGVRLWMTRGEWLFARMLTTDVRDAPPRRGLRLLARGRLGRGADRGRGREGLGPLRRGGQPGAGQLRADAGRRPAPDRRARLAGRHRQRPFARTCLPGRRGRRR